MAVVSAIIIGDIAVHLKPYTFYILALVLSFSTTGIVLSEIDSKKEIFKSISLGIILNYLVFGIVLLGASYAFSISQDIHFGFVVIAASPPGVAIIPFTFMLKGNLKTSTLATFGGFLASVFLAPFIIKFLTGNDQLEIVPLFINMLKIIVAPMLISRIYLLKPLKPITLKIRGQIVNWGFALIIFTAVGVNRDVFLNRFDMLLNVGLILFIAIFVLGQLYDFIMSKLSKTTEERISQNLILTLKSSGFSVVIAMELFGGDVVIPSAMLSIFVLGYLLFLTFKQWLANKKL
jgi:BASS family bile acid:Na+ symporter